MHLVDELFREIKALGYLKDLNNYPLSKRWKKLDEIVKKLNIFKSEMSNLSSDEQLYLAFKIQEKGVNMGLCPHFYIFFSNKYEKFHHTCKALNKQRVYCKGTNKKKCLLKKLDKIKKEK